MAEIEDFLTLDIRTGRIIEVQDFPEARKPAYKLKIDFGELLGLKKSCAQLTQNYTSYQLMGKMVLCIVNFPPRQIAKEISEVLVLGVPDNRGNCVLLQPDRIVPTGARVY